MNREGPNYEVNGETVINVLRSLYYRAGTLRYWRAVRYCSSLLHHTVDSISPFITTVLVNGKQLTVGVIGQKETVKIIEFNRFELLNADFCYII